MTRGKTAAQAAPDVEALVAEVAALKAEVTALKRELAKKPAGGADARVDSVIQYLKLRLQERPEGMSRDEYRQKLEKMVRDL